MSPIPIQVVDFGSFLNGSNKQQTADMIITALKSSGGIVYLTNFGLSNEEVQQMFDWSKRFFELPVEIKQLVRYNLLERKVYSEAKSDKDPAGTVPPNMNLESFQLFGEGSIIPNIWLPEDVLPGFKEDCLAFYWKCHELGKNILRALALGFGLEEDWFLLHHQKAESQLRSIHYASIPVGSLQTNKVARIAAHTNFTTCTLLFQDDVGGLETEDPNEPGSFLPVPSVPNSVVFNAGEFLARWTNDAIPRNVHRVRPPTGVAVTRDGMLADRYSIAYFCSPDLTAIIDCIPGSSAADQPEKYEPVLVKEYAMGRVTAIQHQRNKFFLPVSAEDHQGFKL